jgi:hypothetical protein
VGEGDERELIRLERSLMEPGVRKSPERLRELLAPDFLEFGSSGRVFDREAIVRELQSESPKTVSATDFEVRLLTPETALLTYRSHRFEEGTSFLRSSIWRHREGRWQMVFHQGTRVEA